MCVKYTCTCTCVLLCCCCCLVNNNMCEVLPTIVESTPSPEEENSRLEQLMISMLEVGVVIMWVGRVVMVMYKCHSCKNFIKGGSHEN